MTFVLDRCFDSGRTGEFFLTKGLACGRRPVGIARHVRPGPPDLSSDALDGSLQSPR